MTSDRSDPRAALVAGSELVVARADHADEVQHDDYDNDGDNRGDAEHTRYVRAGRRALVVMVWVALHQLSSV
jgi:hypothetical protein